MGAISHQLSAISQNQEKQVVGSTLSAER